MRYIFSDNLLEGTRITHEEIQEIFSYEGELNDKDSDT